MRVLLAEHDPMIGRALRACLRRKRGGAIIRNVRGAGKRGAKGG
jgi:hypothetical protein